MKISLFKNTCFPRFEEPNSNHRWDSPLFTVQPTDNLDLDAIYSVLFEKKPPPPNMSTQNVSLFAFYCQVNQNKLCI